MIWQWKRRNVIVPIVALVAMAVLWAVVQPAKRMGLTERDYRKIAVGMNEQDVLSILGRPKTRLLPTLQQPDVGRNVSPPMAGHSWDVVKQARAQAAQVWRWHRGFQFIGVVFNDRGSVVFKWVDY